jgi:hypothetical protein
MPDEWVHLTSDQVPPCVTSGAVTRYHGLAPLSDALDHLDSERCCACWVIPRPHPSWVPRPDQFVPVTGERPATQALLWEVGE